MRYRSLVGLSAAVALAIGAGCYTGSAVDSNATPWGNPTAAVDGTDPADGGAGSNIHGLTHLPCEVEKLLERSCWDCHGTVPGYGATTTLVTYEDLTKAVPAIPDWTEANVCVTRMAAGKNTMPPDKKASDEDVAILQKWIDDKTPIGHCGETADGGAGDGGPAVCATGKVVSPTSSRQSALTNPGAACMGCHASNASAFSVAGTVFTTQNEPDNCVGVEGAHVVIIDATGQAHSLATNAVGNFAALDSEYIPFPYRAMVVRGSKIREMQTPQSNGDCNSCHASPGQSTGPDAPGRIMAPEAPPARFTEP